MQKNRSNWKLRLIKLLNIILMISPFVFIWRLLYGTTERLVSEQTQYLLLLSVAALYILFGRIYDAFLLDVGRIHEIVYSQMLSAVVTDAFGFLILWMVMGSFPDFFKFILVIPLQLVFSTLWSLSAHRWYFRHFPPKRTLIIADSRTEALEFSRTGDFAKKFELVDILTTEKLLEDPQEKLCGIEAIFLLHTSYAWAVMQLCAFQSITVYRLPLVSEIIASRAKSITMFYTPLLRMDGYSPKLFYTAAKRLIDLLISGLALLVLSPVMLLVAVAIKLDDGGPVFYRQERLTQNGRHFYILKFRSMRVNAESDGVARLSTGENDPRITPVGRWIRKMRLDELPQLLNILKGDMSIVGPRPERPELTEEYAEILPEFKLRLLAKAGLTGYAQVYGKYNTAPDDKLRMDLLYILSPSIMEDIRLMFATVKILFVPESTEGIEEGQTTAMKQPQPMDEERKAASES